MCQWLCVKSIEILFNNKFHLEILLKMVPKVVDLLNLCYKYDSEVMRSPKVQLTFSAIVSSIYHPPIKMTFCHAASRQWSSN